MSYGECLLKTVNPGTTVTLYVGSPEAACNTVYSGGVQAHSATTEATSYNYLQDAIEKAYSLGAEYTSAEIDIKLRAGCTVIMSRGDDVDYYRPTNTDTRSGTTRINISTTSG